MIPERPAVVSDVPGRRRRKRPISPAPNRRRPRDEDRIAWPGRVEPHGHVEMTLSARIPARLDALPGSVPSPPAVSRAQELPFEKLGGRISSASVSALLAPSRTSSPAESMASKGTIRKGSTYTRERERNFTTSSTSANASSSSAPQRSRAPWTSSSRANGASAQGSSISARSRASCRG